MKAALYLRSHSLSSRLLDGLRHHLKRFNKVALALGPVRAPERWVSQVIDHLYIEDVYLIHMLTKPHPSDVKGFDVIVSNVVGDAYRGTLPPLLSTFVL